MGVLGWLMVWARWQLAQAEAAEGGVCAAVCFGIVTSAMARTIQSSAAGNLSRAGHRAGTGLSFREIFCQQAFAGSGVFAAQFLISLDQGEMNLEIVGVEFQRGVEVVHAFVDATGFDERTAEDELGAGRIGCFGGGFLGVGKGVSSAIAQEEIPRQHHVGDGAGGGDFQFALEFCDGDVGVVGEQEITIQVMSVGGGGKTLEEILKLLVRFLFVSGHEGEGGGAGGEDEGLLRGIDVLGAHGHAQAGEADTREDFGSGAAVFGEDGVLAESSFEIAVQGEEKQLMEAKHVLVAGLVPCSESPVHAEYPERTAGIRRFRIRRGRGRRRQGRSLE